MKAKGFYEKASNLYPDWALLQSQLRASYPCDSSSLPRRQHRSMAEHEFAYSALCRQGTMVATSAASPVMLYGCLQARGHVMPCCAVPCCALPQ